MRIDHFAGSIHILPYTTLHTAKMALHFANLLLLTSSPTHQGVHTIREHA